MKVFAALGAGVCLLATPAGSALANSNHSSGGGNGLPSLPTLNGASGHGNGAGSSNGHSSGSSNHHPDWNDHDWNWLKHKIVNHCRGGHGWGHGGFGWDADDSWGGGGDHDRCHPHHPTSP